MERGGGAGPVGRPRAGRRRRPRGRGCGDRRADAAADRRGAPPARRNVTRQDRVLAHLRPPSTRTCPDAVQSSARCRRTTRRRAGRSAGGEICKLAARPIRSGSSYVQTRSKVYDPCCGIPLLSLLQEPSTRGSRVDGIR
jgi:hypothetical protein